MLNINKEVLLKWTGVAQEHMMVIFVRNVFTLQFIIFASLKQCFLNTYGRHQTLVQFLKSWSVIMFVIVHADPSSDWLHGLSHAFQQSLQICLYKEKYYVYAALTSTEMNGAAMMDWKVLCPSSYFRNRNQASWVRKHWSDIGL